jgi:hypothetical protein
MRLRAQWKGGNGSEFLVSQLLICRHTGEVAMEAADVPYK